MKTNQPTRRRAGAIYILLAVLAAWCAPHSVSAEDAESRLKSFLNGVENARIKISTNDKKKLDMVLKIASKKLKKAGPVLSGLSGLVFNEPDAEEIVEKAVAALRTEMLAYIDTNERDKYSARLDSYKDRLESWGDLRQTDHKPDAGSAQPIDPDKIIVLETIYQDLITEVANFDTWRKKQPAILPLYGALTRLHLDVVEMLAYLDVDPTTRAKWRDEYKKRQEKYVAAARESAGQLVTLRLKKVTAPSVSKPDRTIRGKSGDPIRVPGNDVYVVWYDSAIATAKESDYTEYNLDLHKLVMPTRHLGLSGYEWKNATANGQGAHERHIEAVKKLEALHWQEFVIAGLEAPIRKKIGIQTVRLRELVSQALLFGEKEKARAAMDKLRLLEPGDPLNFYSYFLGAVKDGKEKVGFSRMVDGRVYMDHRWMDYSRYLPNTVDMRMIRMEQPAAEGQPARRFYMSMTEVTGEQFMSVMAEDLRTGAFPDNIAPVKVDGWGQYPAINITWDEAQLFCKRLSEREGVTYRLPTEAEWEFASRAGSRTTWSFGNDKRELGRYAWYLDNVSADDKEKHHARYVAQLQPNAWGLYDMYGNVREWCEERHGNNEGDEERRGLRGGGWRTGIEGCNSSSRDSYLRKGRSPDIGFRVVLEESK